MKTITATVVMLTLATMQANLLAQDPASGSTSFPAPAQGGVQAYRHASTAIEGGLRGWADLYRAKGEYNYNTAAAALIFEHARRAHIDNKLRYAEVFWAKRQLYESNQAALKQIRSENSVQVRPAARPVAIPTAAQLINPSQPGFAWPLALGRPELSRSREQLALLFSQRVQGNSGRGSENHWHIRNAVLEARASLAHLVKEMPPFEYVEARQFLDRVLYTAEQAVEVQVAVK